MKILEEEIERGELKDAENILEGGMVKAVVDVDREIIGVDAEMHADIEQMLLANGSNQDALWGINLWFEEKGDDFVEFDSMINIRPRQGNRSRSVENPETQQKIREVVAKWIK